MSEVVWKFPIPATDDFELEMPVGAKVVHVAMQNGEPCVWALVDPTKALELRRFRLACTGDPITVTGDYVGTFMRWNGALMYHLFVEPAP
jgi:hypothetical protein